MSKGPDLTHRDLVCGDAGQVDRHPLAGAGLGLVQAEHLQAPDLDGAIRAAALVARQQLQALADLDPALFQGAGHHGAEAFNRKPVSYPHLRAHENVLELVCRFLLEKKPSSPSTDHMPFSPLSL